MEAGKLADERDIFIAMKSGHTTLRIINYLLLIVEILSLVLYGMTKIQTLMIVGATLCSVTVAILLVIILVNIYYEKHL
jgi:cytosine/uracil/thiamine/allantoin permease